MSTVSFKGIKALKYGLDPLIGAIQNNTRLWPPTATTWSLSRNPGDSTGNELVAFVGDQITLSNPATAFWLDAHIAMFKIVGNGWTETFKAPTSGLIPRQLTLENRSTQGMTRGDKTYPFTIDTTAMEPGDYVLAAGDYYEYFVGRGVQLTIHLHPPFPKVRPQEFTIDLRKTNWKYRYTLLAQNQYWGDDEPGCEVPNFKVPAGTQQIKIIPDGQTVEVQAMWIALPSNVRVKWGRSADLSSPGPNDTMQGRDGGVWILPDSNPGDKAVCCAGFDLAGYQLDVFSIDFV